MKTLTIASALFGMLALTTAPVITKAAELNPVRVEKTAVKPSLKQNAFNYLTRFSKK